MGDRRIDWLGTSDTRSGRSRRGGDSNSSKSRGIAPAIMHNLHFLHKEACLDFAMELLCKYN
jgi:hypothetical protein